MLHREFTERVGIEVSTSEFDAINTVYMASDLEKDEFCAMWRKMNAKRIKAYKAEQKAKEERFNRIQRLYAIKQTLWLAYTSTDYQTILKLDEVISRKDIEFLKKNDFDVMVMNYTTYVMEYKAACEMHWEIERYIDKEVKIA